MAVQLFTAEHEIAMNALLPSICSTADQVPFERTLTPPLPSTAKHVPTEGQETETPESPPDWASFVPALQPLPLKVYRFCVVPDATQKVELAHDTSFRVGPIDGGPIDAQVDPLNVSMAPLDPTAMQKVVVGHATDPRDQ
jgi:hypothetical protein